MDAIRFTKETTFFHLHKGHIWNIGSNRHVQRDAKQVSRNPDQLQSPGVLCEEE